MKKNNLFTKPLTACVFCFLLFASFTQVFAQNPNCFRLTFSDKNGSPYSIERPEEFLSPRAIAKRARFNIPVTVQDLPVNPQYITSIQNAISTPTRIISTSKWNNSIVIFFPEDGDYQNIVDNILATFTFVTEAQPVAYYNLTKNSKTSLPEQNSTSIVYNPSCDYNYGSSIDNMHLHKGEFLHKAGFCGEDMLICVFDVGWEDFDKISYFRPLYENGQIWGTRDLIPGMNNVYTEHGHGTLVTSEMASMIEGQMVGTAPKANYFFIRSDDPIREQPVEEDFYAQASEIADSLGADVSTASLGYTTFDYEWQNTLMPADNNGTSSIASRAATILTQKGVIVVIAAGNSGTDSWHYISRPADAFNILAVGAVDKNGAIASYSSYGPSADGRVKPDVAAPGHGSWIVYGEGAIMPFGSGTSCATPIIAGLSACLWQALPQYSSSEVMQLIRKYGDCFNNPNDRTGYGIPNFYQIYLDHYNHIPENKISSFSVYPNPTSGEVHVTFPSFGETGVVNHASLVTNIEVFDVYGRKQSHSSLATRYETDEVVINISHLSAGLYFLKITSENVFVKVVKR